MYRRTLPFGRKGIGMTAISAVDLAVWDAKGKILKQPVFKLLGGRTKSKIPVYASRLYSQPLDTLYAEAKAYAEQGFRPVKLRFGWGPKDGYRRACRRTSIWCGPRARRWATDVDIMADCYMGWNVEYARRMLRMLDAAQPALGRRAGDLRRPCTATPNCAALNLVAISGGEHEYTLARLPPGAGPARPSTSPSST